MPEKGPYKSWLEVLVARQLAVGAVWPPSQEQIDAAVAKKRQELETKRAFQQTKSDIEFDNMIKAARAKYN